MKYYLINNMIMKTLKVLPLSINHDISDFSQTIYNLWLSSLQPCEISESELDKVVKHLNAHFGVVYGGKSNSNPIDVTDIVDVENVRVVCIDCPNVKNSKSPKCIEGCETSKTMIKFKQPTEKQVESDDMIKYILEIDALTTTEFCNKYNVPKPVFTGEVNSSVNEMLRIDAVKHRMFVQKAKEIFKNR